MPPWKSLSGRWNWTPRKSMPRWKSRWGGHHTVLFESPSPSRKVHSDLKYDRNVFTFKESLTKISHTKLGQEFRMRKGCCPWRRRTPTSTRAAKKEVAPRGRELGPWGKGVSGQAQPAPWELAKGKRLCCASSQWLLLAPPGPLGAHWPATPWWPRVQQGGGELPIAVQTRRWVLSLPWGVLDWSLN